MINYIFCLDPFMIKLAAKFNMEAKARNLSNMKQCKVGLEIHFKNGGNCAVKKTKTRRRKRDWCICWRCIMGEGEKEDTDQWE